MRASERAYGFTKAFVHAAAAAILHNSIEYEHVACMRACGAHAHTEGVLGLDGAVGGERLRLSLRVDGGHPEVVLLPLLEPRHVERQRPLVPGHLADLDPALRSRVQLLNLVLLRVDSIESCFHFFITSCFM